MRASKREQKTEIRWCRERRSGITREDVCSLIRELRYALEADASSTNTN